MNVRKPTDYSVMFKGLDDLMAASLPQMELYCEIGRLVRARPEKGPPLLPLNISVKHILTSLASPLGICAGCGIFTKPMRVPRIYWPRQ